jgi:hypothetical protein
MSYSGLKEFKAVLRDFRSLGAYLIVGAMGTTITLAMTNFAPPWPNGISVLTSLTELLVLIFVFNFWYKKTPEQVSKGMKVALVFLTVGFFLYLFFLDTYTFTFPGTGERWAKGFCIRDGIKPLVQELGGDLEALKGAEYNQEAIWKPWSITLVRLTLLFLWLWFFTNLAVFVGTFVINQRRIKRRGRLSS